MTRAFVVVMLLLLCSSFTADSVLECPGGSFAKAEPGFSRANVARIALDEWRWWRGRPETEAAVKPRLESYWVSAKLSHWSAAAAIGSQAHWSAAFVSHVMRRAGAGQAFAYSGSQVCDCSIVTNLASHASRTNQRFSSEADTQPQGRVGVELGKRCIRVSTQRTARRPNAIAGATRPVILFGFMMLEFLHRAWAI
jgi:hypothetical protein